MTKDQDEFNQIKTELVTEIRGMRKDLDRMVSMIDTHEKVLYGDRVKEPGLTEDVRNLRAMAGYAKAGGIGILSLIGEFLFRTFFHHPKGG